MFPHMFCSVANRVKSIYDFCRMARAIKVVMVLLCITCLLALCIAPWVDPPETTLKSLQIILLLMSAFLIGLFMPAAVFSLSWRLPIGIMRSRSFPLPDLSHPREISCVQQC